MYVNPFWMGVFTTIFVEIIALIVFTVCCCINKK